jgi:hypothetical protein
MHCECPEPFAKSFVAIARLVLYICKLQQIGLLADTVYIVDIEIVLSHYYYLTLLDAWTDACMHAGRTRGKCQETPQLLLPSP